MQDNTRDQLTQARDIHEVAALRIVANTTRFATTMCVFIAMIKVYVYLKTEAAVMKTSALDSLGDLVANIISMYTSYRMSNVDLTRYPIGQSRLEPIGVLIFSTLMATMMFGNAIENFGDLMGEEELSREAAVRGFWTGLFGTHFESGHDHHEWRNPEQGFLDLASFLNLTAIQEAASGNSGVLLNNVVAAGNFSEASKVVEQTILDAAQVEDPLTNGDKLLFTNMFLAVCATYKFLLWNYCTWYAIPKTGSSVLVALAGDKRNDFICTSSVIIATTLAKLFEDTLSQFMDVENVDPLLSLTMACVLIYVWSLFIMEEATALSSETCGPDFIDPCQRKILASLRHERCGAEVKAYYSSHKRTVEVDLIISDGTVPFSSVEEKMGQVQQIACEMDDVERAIVVPKSMQYTA